MLKLVPSSGGSLKPLLFLLAEKHVKRGMLTIYTNHPSENRLQKHRTIKFDVLGQLPTKNYIDLY